MFEFAFPSETGTQTENSRSAGSVRVDSTVCRTDVSTVAHPQGIIYSVATSGGPEPYYGQTFVGFFVRAVPGKTGVTVQLNTGLLQEQRKIQEANESIL